MSTQDDFREVRLMGKKKWTIVGIIATFVFTIAGAYLFFQSSDQTNNITNENIEKINEQNTLENMVHNEDQELNQAQLNDSIKKETKPGLGQKIKSLFGMKDKSAITTKDGYNTDPSKKISKIKKACYKVTYRRNKDKNLSWEDYSKLQNIISIEDPDVLPKSVCVRVNGIPVKYRLTKNHQKKNSYDVIVHGQAGPNAEITTSYCIGEVTCIETCKVPKDEFMAALGMDGNSFNETQYVAWGNNKQGKKKKGPSRAEKKLDSEYKAFAKEMNKAIIQHGPTFKGWKKKNKTASCPKKKHKKSIQKVRLGEQAKTMIFRKNG